MRFSSIETEVSPVSMRMAQRAGCSVTHGVLASATIVARGQEGRGCFVVESGFGRVHRARKTHWCIGPGAFFGEDLVVRVDARYADMSSVIRCDCMPYRERYSVTKRYRSGSSERKAVSDPQQRGLLNGGIYC